jgi:hypothetical protein
MPASRSKQTFVLIKFKTFRTCGGRDSSVGMATGYGLDGPGIELAASVV